jgi:hypothetical protein
VLGNERDGVIREMIDSATDYLKEMFSPGTLAEVALASTFFGASVGKGRSGQMV